MERSLWGKENRKSNAAGRRPKVNPAVEPLEPRWLLSGFRSIDGTGNNLQNPDWGSAGVDLLRIAPAAYGDGVSSPAGADRPSARVISNTVSAQPVDVPNARNLSDWVYGWGQFIDHDLDLTSSGSSPFDVPVPAGDPYFDPGGTGTQVISLNRSVYDPATGTDTDNPRQQPNQITAFLDGSVVYGSDATRAAALRTFVGGMLKTSDGNLLPFNTDGLPNANDAHLVPDDQLFLAGDVRANENIELIAIQTLFVREHNRLAAQFAAAHPSWTDEQLYQAAREMVWAEIEVITYREFLPALLGPGALKPYAGYNPAVNPGIATEFSTGAYRVGHSLLNGDIKFMDNDGNEIQPALQLRDAFFNPVPVEQAGIDPILKYLASDNAQEVDTKVVDDVRNFLFGPPGSGGFDLASLNIQRGRDHGLADYNTVRQAYGLPPVTDFDQITSDPALQDQLRSLYGDVNNIDLWVGGLAEDHVAGSSLGPTFRTIIADQFERTRDGDSFWYQHVFSGSQLKALEQVRLSDIIRWNTTITNVQDNVFYFTAGTVSGHVFVDFNHDGKREPGEPGRAGVTIRLLDSAGALLAVTKTGADGTYYFTGLAAGTTYKVQIMVPPGLELTTPPVLTVKLADSAGAGEYEEDFGVFFVHHRGSGPADDGALAAALLAVAADPLLVG
jgi:hypothetical protein